MSFGDVDVNVGERIRRESDRREVVFDRGAVGLRAMGGEMGEVAVFEEEEVEDCEEERVVVEERVRARRKRSFSGILSNDGLLLMVVICF